MSLSERNPLNRSGDSAIVPTVPLRRLDLVASTGRLFQIPLNKKSVGFVASCN